MACLKKTGVENAWLSEWSIQTTNNVMAYVNFNKDGILCGYTGDSSSHVFTWSYDDFEKYLGECITPSMYSFMAEYVRKNISKEELYAIGRGEYRPDVLEEYAVDAYFEVPTMNKIEMHEEMLEKLEKQKALVEAKEIAAINAILDDTLPFGVDSPINHEYTEFLNGLVMENRRKVDRLENAIHEEEQWRGGHEKGAEDF